MLVYTRPRLAVVKKKKEFDNYFRDFKVKPGKDRLSCFFLFSFNALSNREFSYPGIVSAQPAREFLETSLNSSRLKKKQRKEKTEE